MVRFCALQCRTSLTFLDDSINAPNIRKPLTGKLIIRILAVKDVDHASTSRFSRAETSVVVKVEDSICIRTRATRNDKWENETHELNVDKANEMEITVYDKPGDHLLPIGLLWIRISDIAEEMRRKKIEQEIQNSGWVSADKMQSGGFQGQGPQSPQGGSFPQTGSFPGPPPNSGSAMSLNSGGRTVAAAPEHQDPVIEAWFALEPVGQIRLQLKFGKFTAKLTLS